MIRTEKRIRLCAVLLVLMLAFIWGNSLLPREASQAFSDGFRELLLRFLPHGGTHAGQGSGQLRKIAHFAEFALLGLLLRWLLGMLKKRIYLPILLGVAAACVDETIQIFVPGRGPGIRDVWIDSCGVLTGVILLTLGHTIMKIIHGFFGGK